MFKPFIQEIVSSVCHHPKFSGGIPRAWLDDSKQHRHAAPMSITTKSVSNVTIYCNKDINTNGKEKENKKV